MFLVVMLENFFDFIQFKQKLLDFKIVKFGKYLKVSLEFSSFGRLADQI